MANRVTNLLPSFDDNLRLAAGQTVTSGSEQGEVSAVDVELDFGVFDGNIDKFVVVANVGAIDNGNADETYVLSVQSSDDNTFATIDSEYIITLDRDEDNRQYIWVAASRAQFMRLLITVAGNTPSIVLNNVFITRIP